MQTDSEQLLHAGVGVGQRTFDALLQSSGLERHQFDRTVCHQVGQAHRRLMLETLQMPESNDYSNFHWMGNTGSVALPMAFSLRHSQWLHPGWPTSGIARHRFWYQLGHARHRVESSSSGR